jgi:hypothetical protein
MIDTRRLQPKISPLEIWRIGMSFIFIVLGLVIDLAFASSRLGGGLHAQIGRALPLPILQGNRLGWGAFALGTVVLLYGIWRLWSGLRAVRNKREPDAS